jgi:ABC-type polysaccharide/polyol phosphate transport system ATPase subunit
MARIVLENVNLTFRVNRRGRRSLKDWVINGFRFPPDSRIEVRAVQDFSLSLEEGHRIGVIGHNGAGKSTLLRILAGVYQPTTGTRIAEGKICSLFDLALGFEDEATGWENILYRGYMQRETPASIRAKQKDIAEFSELGEALDMPVRCYSAGMRVRLAFSIATSIEPEILLLDEVLSAGDIAFQAKARQRMQQLIKRAQLMVLVTHDLESLNNFCDRILWMDHGKIRMLGEPNATIKAYKQFMTPTAKSATSPAAA